MIGERLSDLSLGVMVVAAVVVAVLGGGVYLVVSNAGWGATTTESEDSPMHVEEFRVAEPLDLETPTDEPWETIAAVTEPYDEVEAAMGEESKELAAEGEELAHQCQTVLKEMAFCTSEDSFLDIIGTASNLRTGAERERFMERVQHWFEPGGAKGDCVQLLELEGMSGEEAKQMWARTSESTGRVCDDFGEVLLETEAFSKLGVFWE